MLARRLQVLAEAFAAAPEGAAGPAAGNNFTKGVRWSPDSLCVLACSEDAVLRLFEVDPAGKRAAALPALSCAEGECVYDYAWYPRMSSADPVTCCFASTSKDHPVHLWDAFTGALRASYTALTETDGLDAALSVAFTPCGSRMLAGYRECIRAFEVGRPGAPVFTRPTVELARGASGRRFRWGQRGLISCLAVEPRGTGLYAAGSYSGSLAVYSDSDGAAALWVPRAFARGVTQVSFSPDGLLVFAGGRAGGGILGWDLRQPAEPLHRLERPSSTHQRLGFELDPAGRWLVSGTDGPRAVVFDLEAPAGAGARVCELPSASGAVVNGVALCPARRDGPEWLAMTSTGTRARAASGWAESSGGEEARGSEEEGAGAAGAAVGEAPAAAGVGGSLELWAVGPAGGAG